MPDSTIKPISGEAASVDRTRLLGLSITNLKSFVGTHEILLAPLTLVYGPNSAGKSSLMEAPLLLLDYLWLSPFGSEGMRPVTDRSEWARIVKDWRREISGHSDDLTLGLGVTAMDGRSTNVKHVSLGVALAKPNPKTLGITITSRVGEGPASTSAAISMAGREVVDEVDETESPEAHYGFNPNDFEGGDDGPDMGLMGILASIKALDPHRGDPTKTVKFDPSYRWVTSGNSDYKGFFSDADTRISEWFVDLGVPYAVERAVTRSPAGAPFRSDYRRGEARWNLTDLRSGHSVELGDVGYGVSQLLPIVEALSAPDASIVMIQEPESHLHPKLQSAVGELLVDAVTQGKQVIAETHSENILLRVQRLVREGRLAPDDVAVLYVDQPDESSRVRRLRLGANGQLLDPWPTGFFDDSLDDLLGGWQ